MEEREPLRIFMPGAFAGMPDDLRVEFATRAPEAELWFHAFVPSGILAREILDGEVADVAVSANPKFMTALWSAGFATDPRVLAGNRLCIIVRPDQSEQVRDLHDLLRDDVRVVTPQSDTDPCGQYVAEMFARAGAAGSMHRKEDAGTLIHSVGSGDLPAFGRTDAGIFYASEARALADRVSTVELPPELDLCEQIIFVISAIKKTERAHPLAPVFVDFMTGARGQALLSRYGFLPSDSVSTNCFPWNDRDDNAESRESGR